MQDDAKPIALRCPLCGAKPHYGLQKVEHCSLHGEPFQRFAIWCPKGHVRVDAMNEALALKEWNTRTPAPAQPADVERVRDAIARRMRPGLFLGSPEMQHKAARPLSVEAAKERILANAADYARAALAAMQVGGPVTPPADADAGLVEALEESRRWEAKLILDERSWVVDSGVHIPQDLWDEYISTVQTKREAALGQGGVR